MFGLREWEEEGFTPQAQDAEDPSYDPVAARKTRQPSARVSDPLSPPLLLLNCPVLFVLPSFTCGTFSALVWSKSTIH